MNKNDKINFEYSLRQNGMKSTLFWELDGIVRNAKSLLAEPSKGIFPEGTDLEEVREAVRSENWDKVRKLTGALI